MNINISSNWFNSGLKIWRTQFATNYIIIIKLIMHSEKVAYVARVLTANIQTMKTLSYFFREKSNNT